VASLVVRFRRSRGEERQQLKWFVYVMVLVISYSLADMILVQNLSNAVSLTLGSVILTCPWIAIAAAIWKRGLYDIDFLINRTLVYGALTATLALVYISSVISLQAVLRILTGQESTLSIVASTLAMAALFNRCVDGCKLWWTAASTEVSTTPPKPWPPSTPGCA
jgi:hypothetical protein